VNIRKATAQDIEAMSQMLARSFHDDPIVEWVFRNEDTRPKYAARFFAGRARVLNPQNEIYTVDGIAGAAMWARPGEWRDPPLKAARELALLVPGVGRRIVQTVRGLIQVESRHPKPPHWYLAVLGTDPDRQGEGIGTALLQPVLEGCDRHEIPAYLETGKERNIAFYARHGFKVTEELKLPNGPPIWLMWRKPRP
jgi:N-acetylglutamate synthase-like GNAT family acetyltransferase